MAFEGGREAFEGERWVLKVSEHLLEGLLERHDDPRPADTGVPETDRRPVSAPGTCCTPRSRSPIASEGSHRGGQHLQNGGADGKYDAVGVHRWRRRRSRRPQRADGPVHHLAERRSRDDGVGRPGDVRPALTRSSGTKTYGSTARWHRRPVRRHVPEIAEEQATVQENAIRAPTGAAGTPSRPSACRPAPSSTSSRPSCRPP